MPKGITLEWILLILFLITFYFMIHFIQKYKREQGFSNQWMNQYYRIREHKNTLCIDCERDRRKKQ